MPQILPTHNPELPIEKSQSWQMFNEISSQYDRLNRILSFGLDLHWRRKMAKQLEDKPNQRILDLATGTADVLLSLCENSQKITAAIGIDRAEKMLARGRSKVEASGLTQLIDLQQGDITKVPFPDNSFDVTSIAFGIRNVPNPEIVLNEMFRVLKPEGKTLILEFSLPDNPLVRWGHRCYLRYALPWIGFLLSGHYSAYRYLNQTIESFPCGPNFCRLIEGAGFNEVHAYPLMLGTATIYVGKKKMLRS